MVPTARQHAQLGVDVMPATLEVAQRHRLAHVLTVASLQLLLLWPALAQSQLAKAALRVEDEPPLDLARGRDSVIRRREGELAVA